MDKLLPDIANCKTIRKKIDAFLNHANQKQLERIYKAIKAICLLS